MEVFDYDHDYDYAYEWWFSWLAVVVTNASGLRHSCGLRSSSNPRLAAKAAISETIGPSCCGARWDTQRREVPTGSWLNLRFNSDKDRVWY